MKKIRSALTTDKINCLRAASFSLYGHKRRAYHAELAIKYCGGSARRAESVFGFGRVSTVKGLYELATGEVILSKVKKNKGKQRCEIANPILAEELKKIDAEYKARNVFLTTKLAYRELTKRGVENLPALDTLRMLFLRLKFRTKREYRGNQEYVCR
jgi:hypothetical protein